MIEIADIKASVQSGRLIQDKFFKNADFLKDSRGRLLTFTGGYTVVMPAMVKGEKWAFRCWHTPVIDAKQRYSLIGKAIKKTKLPYFCSFDYSEKGLVIKGESFPITKMRWIEGMNLKRYICKNFEHKDTIKRLAKKFLDLIFDLHAQNIAHGDLQHGNIIVADSGDISLVDYDSMYVPEMKDRYLDIITGLVDYQHPSRKSNRISSSKIDFFSEVVIYTSLLAISKVPELVKKYNVEDSECLLFTSKDFENLFSSEIYRDLKSIKNKEIDLCLDILKDYLSIDDITKLNPIESYLMSIAIESPRVVPINEDFTIKWISKGAKYVNCSECGELPLIGEIKLNIIAPKTLTFTLISESGYEIFESIRIEVSPRAEIQYFKADKEYTLDTIPVKLSWLCTNAKKVEIIGEGEVASSGNVVVTPKDETTYTLGVEDDFGIQRRTITIRKLPLPLIRNILVPVPNINKNIGIIYQAPKFNASIPTPTLQTVFGKINLPKIPILSKSGYYVHSLGWDKKTKSRNIFKSLFSIFSRNKR